MENPEDTIILTEREYVYFGMCPAAVDYLKSLNMFGKPNKEVKECIARSGKHEWIKDWEETHLSPDVLARIKKRLHSEYYTSVFVVTNDFAKTQYTYNTLEEAIAKDKENKVEFLNRLGDPYDPSLEITPQVGYHYKLFRIEEKMTTFTGHVVNKVLSA
jgi:hypothetical protein